MALPIYGSIKSKMAADSQRGYTKMAITSQRFVTGLPINVIFGSRVGFPAELRFLP